VNSTNESAQYFEDVKQMTEIGFKYYKPKTALENVQALADEMVFIGADNKRFSHILKDTYTDTVIEKIDLK
jgi:hypothetical protein